MQLKEILALMIKHEASDAYFTVGAPIAMKIQGQLRPVNKESLTSEQVKALAYSDITDMQRSEFETTHELNTAISYDDIGRFRINIFQQRNEPGMVIRRIETDIPSIEKLGLPSVLQELAMNKRGLILFVGGTGSGKSTSLASMIDYRNTNAGGHIITIEDPVEFAHPHKKSIITQREVGVDTDSFEAALQNTLRQAPDVILIGEIRTPETMEKAIQFAETGHLCLSTLHANNANQALDRIINFFPEEKRNQLLLDLSLNLRAIISQRLIPSVDGKRAAAIEVMINSPAISDLVRIGDVSGIKELMGKTDSSDGTITFDDALYNLLKDGKITEENALKNADSENNLRLKIQLDKGADLEGDNGLSIDED